MASEMELKLLKKAQKIFLALEFGLASMKKGKARQEVSNFHKRNVRSKFKAFQTILVCKMCKHISLFVQRLGMNDLFETALTLSEIKLTSLYYKMQHLFKDKSDKVGISNVSPYICFKAF